MIVETTVACITDRFHFWSSYHLLDSLRCSIHTQEPMSLSLRVTSRAIPPPPQTRMLALSGSNAARVTAAESLHIC